MNALANTEGYCGTKNIYNLLFSADKMHFYPALSGVIKGVVFKGFEPKCSVQLAVYAGQNVAVKPGSNPGSIVIVLMQIYRRFFCIYTNQEPTVRPQCLAGI